MAQEFLETGIVMDNGGGQPKLFDEIINRSKQAFNNFPINVIRNAAR